MSQNTGLTQAELSKNTCSPSGKKLVTFRLYYILFPILLFLLVVESVYIISSLPDGIGSAFTAARSLPAISQAASKAV